tara:strand:+ start:985 stop:3492 length:2508 start_codon:yes stop_codon:yes gene_type:complete
MNTHAEKTKEKKSQSIAKTVSQKQNGNEPTLKFVDNRPEATTQLKLNEMADNSPQVSQLRAIQGVADNNPQGSQVAQLKSMADNHSAQNQQPIQKRENNTGLPDNLKTGMENLSGMSLDDVKVHRNSDKPAQLQAHAYAQGTDIHLGSGQEKHLPHELGHVVQQKEGRVKPTLQMKGKENINDDVGLEKEADVMGAKAIQLESITPTPLSTSQSTSDTIQREVQGGKVASNNAIDEETTRKRNAAAREAYLTEQNGKSDKDAILKEDADKAAEGPGTARTLIETGVSVGLGIEGAVGTITDAASPNSLTADHMDWNGNKKRSDTEANEWRDKNEHSEKGVKDMKAGDATKAAVTGSIDLVVGFMNIPSMIKKFQSAKTLDNLEAALDTADLTAKAVGTGAKIADAAEGGTNKIAGDTAKISGLTGDIIGSVKKGFDHFKNLKNAYDDYQLIKNSGGTASKSDGAFVAFNAALDTAQTVLGQILSIQKNFGSVVDSGVASAIPGIGIVISSISIFSKIISMAKNGQLNLEGAANEEHTDSILAQIPEDEREQARGILSSSYFQELITSAAEFRQIQRDNPEIFEEYEKAQAGTPEAEKLKKRLKKRFPSNYKKIEEVYNKNKMGLGDLVQAIQHNAGKHITEEMVNDIIDDQTLMNHLEEIKGKRQKNASIGIFIDLINIGADIATLTGVGAAAGAGMKAGTAAFAGSRKAGNAVKFASRASGAEGFASGAEGGLFGSSVNDHSNILKSEKAKRERYFTSSKIVLDNIIGHDEKSSLLPDNLNEDQAKKNSASYKNVCTKIGAAGGSVTLVKAMINTPSKTGNDIVKYLMDKLKTR